MSKRRTHSPEFKARVAMEAISGRKTIQEIAADHSIHPIQVSHWKRQLLDGASELFARGKQTKDKEEGQTKEAELFQQIGRLQMELEWLKKSLSRCDACELRKLVDHDHPEISVSRQCVLLRLPRSTLYYRSIPVRESTQWIMARIDALYLEDPCSGSRRMVDDLAREGIPISRDRVRNLMRRMGLWAIYQKLRTTVPGDPSKRFPCLVDLKLVTAVDQVWDTDITYIPLRKGFLYLVAIVNLFSRNVLSWRRSNSLDTEFCLEALEMALEGGASQRSFILIRAANSPHPTLWPGCRLRRSRSAGQAESAAMTTSLLNGCGGPSRLRRSTYGPTAMAGRLRSAWADF
jgi:putative transposase